MKNKLLSLFALLLFSASVSAQSLRFEKPMKLKTANGEPINMEASYSVPTFHDIDGDGKLDLISGDYHGVFHVFRNVGSNEKPTYDQPYLLQAGGENARVPVI